MLCFPLGAGRNDEFAPVCDLAHKSLCAMAVSEAWLQRIGQRYGIATVIGPLSLAIVHALVPMEAARVLAGDEPNNIAECIPYIYSLGLGLLVLLTINHVMLAHHKCYQSLLTACLPNTVYAILARGAKFMATAFERYIWPFSVGFIFLFHIANTFMAWMGIAELSTWPFVVETCLIGWLTATLVKMKLSRENANSILSLSGVASIVLYSAAIHSFIEFMINTTALIANSHLTLHIGINIGLLSISSVIGLSLCFLRYKLLPENGPVSLPYLADNSDQNKSKASQLFERGYRVLAKASIPGKALIYITTAYQEALISDVLLSVASLCMLASLTFSITMSAVGLCIRCYQPEPRLDNCVVGDEEKPDAIWKVTPETSPASLIKTQGLMPVRDYGTFERDMRLTTSAYQSAPAKAGAQTAERSLSTGCQHK